MSEVPFIGNRPVYAHPGDAGADLFSTENCVLDPLERHLFATGTKVSLKENQVGYITPRSGLAHKKGVTVLNAPGTIDSGYRGELKVNLVNLSNESVLIEAGDRIGQFVVHEFITANYVSVESFEESERGTNGHGSTDNR